jgi:hypothetical protein
VKVICPYCSAPAVYVDSSEVYARSYGMIYLCRPCKAWVGVHKGTDKPLGRLANKELREWKMRAHAAFDPLWQKKLRKCGPRGKKSARKSGYHWLAAELGIPVKECHIGMMDVEQCKRVVEICSPYLRMAA